MRVARERRSRMRATLLQSVLSVYSSESAKGPAVIDDVVRHAGVARGTFYHYFTSLEQAVAELGLQLADEMTAGIYSVYDVLDDPALRTATGFQMFLCRALAEPEWGGFISRIGLLTGDNLFTHHIQTDIELGVSQGVYQVPSIEVATDLLMGAKVEAIRRILQGGGRGDYIRSMAQMVLQGFGMETGAAAQKVRFAFDRLSHEAPSLIKWWRPVPDA